MEISNTNSTLILKTVLLYLFNDIIRIVRGIIGNVSVHKIRFCFIKCSVCTSTQIELLIQASVLILSNCDVVNSNKIIFN